HVSVLRRGHSPHPPHTHREEELLIVLSGMADVILPEVPSSEGDFHHRLNAGDFVYYPAWFPHTLVGVSEEPVNYLMFKWFCDVAQEQEKELPHSKHTAFSSSNSYGSNTIRYQALFDGPTRCLRKLHCHCTIINPGASYAAHVDPYDVAILVLDGTVETDGQVAEKGAVIFYPAGQPHGMKNTTEEIAKYIVFEFHGAHDFSENELAPLTMNVPKAVDEDEDRAKLRDLERIVALHKHQVEGLERSYSLFIGRLITRSIIFLFGWIPPVKMWIKNL
ncbi:MAG: cupin domain-containing protein, partial [Saprospiraceae bacterium]|nr:cupin domain-containing protein [Saprospiraceae bacterium]